MICHEMHEMKDDDPAVVLKLRKISPRRAWPLVRARAQSSFLVVRPYA